MIIYFSRPWRKKSGQHFSPSNGCNVDTFSSKRNQTGRLERLRNNANKFAETQTLSLGQIRILKREQSSGVYGIVLDQVKAARQTEDAFDWSEEGTDAVEQDIGGDRSGQIVKVSISHDGDYATAVCLAAEEPAEGDVGGEAAARGMF